VREERLHQRPLGFVDAARDGRHRDGGRERIVRDGLCSAVAEVVTREHRLGLCVPRNPGASPRASMERLLQRAVLALDGIVVAAPGKALDA
jgi:hypothetical protein